jgi:hypothetical protein
MPSLFTRLLDRVDRADPAKAEPRTPLPLMPKPQFLQGHLTALSLLISAIGTIASAFGLHLPASEINGLLTWLAANWDSITQGAGLILAAYGQLRRNWRPAATAAAALLLMCCNTACMAAGGNQERWFVATISTDAEGLTAGPTGLAVTKLNQSNGANLFGRIMRNAAIAGAAPGVAHSVANMASKALKP